MRFNSTTVFLLLISFAVTTSLNAQTFRLKRLQREQYTPPNNVVVKTDDAVFYYTGNKGGMVTWQWAESISLNPLRLYYEPSTALGNDSLISKVDYRAGPSGTPWGIFRNRQQFNSAGQLVDFVLYQYAPNDSFVAQKSTEHHTYSGNTLTESTINNNIYAQTYQNGVLQSTDVTTLGPPKKLSRKILYSYDAAGNLKEVVNGHVAGADTIFTIYNYDNQDRMTESVRIIHLSSYKDTVEQRFYIYDSNGDLVEEDHFWDGHPNLFQCVKLMSVYNNQHRKTELISHYVGNGLPLNLREKRSFTYNNDGLLTKIENKNWDGTQWISHFDSSAVSSSNTCTFEYEVVWPTGVPELEDAANVKLYPSPASDFIRIETEWKKAQPFTAAILDMQGRVVRQWDEPATTNYARTIPLTELPAGMYVIKLSCRDEQYSKQFSVFR